MTIPHKQCPRCGTGAPLDATFCGQCGRQYRTAVVPAGAASAPPALFDRPPGAAILIPRWIVRSGQVVVALLVCLFVLAISGIFRPGGKGSVAAVTAAPASPGGVAPPSTATAEARRLLREDPVEAEARRVVNRESQKLDLPPPVSTDGRIHLRSGGTISQEEWDAASRRLQQSPALREPPKPPPF